MSDSIVLSAEDYKKKSDFDVNKMVAIKAGHKSYHDDGSYTNDGINVTVKGNGILGWFNPCKNPNDMWPLIFKNGICITVNRFGEWTASALNIDGTCKQYSDANPLRAAAIVLLMLNQ